MNNKRKKFWGSNPKFKQQKFAGATSSNRFHPLSDEEESDAISIQSDEAAATTIKIPPIVIDCCHNFSKLIELLGQKCKYKRMSIGTKVMPNTLLDYDEIVKL